VRKEILRICIIGIALMFGLGMATSVAPQQGIAGEGKIINLVKNIGVEELAGKVRVAIDTSQPADYRVSKKDYQYKKALIIDINNAINKLPKKSFPVGKGALQRIRTSQYKSVPTKVVRIVLDLSRWVKYDVAREGNRLYAELGLPKKPLSREEENLLSMDFKDADIGNVLRILGEKSGLNIVTDPSIKGKITIYLREVPAEDALELILQVNELSYQKTNNVLMVASQEKLAAMVPRVVETIRLQRLDATKAKEILKGLKFKEENIQVDEERSRLIVIDTPDNIRRIKESLVDIDQPPLQVMLEAKIVEASVDALKEFGFEWGGESPDVKKIMVTPVEAEDREVDFEDIFRLNVVEEGWHGVGISAALNILEDKGKARVLANPRLTTLNNEKATMLIGDRVPYTVTTVVEGVATTEVRYIEAGIRLEVTPRVTEGGYIITRIKPEVSYIYSWVGDNPWIKTREAEAVVWLKDGESAILSGLLSEEEREKLSKVPILGHIPGLGLLFTKERKEKTKTEVIIIVTPHILTQEEAAKLTKQGQARMKKAQGIFRKR